MQLPIFPPFILVSLVVFACCLISAGIGILLTRGKFKKIKFIKARIIIALSFVGIITLYFLFYTVSNLIGRNSVKAMWNKVEATGISIKAEKIIPKPPENPSDNAVPLYKAAIALLESVDMPDRRFKLDKKYKKYCDIPSWTNKDRAEALKLSKEQNVQMALSLFSQGTKKTYAVNKREYKGLKTLMPQLRGYRELFRTMSFVSNCYAHEGKLNEAYDLTIDGFTFIHQFRNDPCFIGQLVYIACTWIDLETVRLLVSRYGISSKKAQKIINLLDKLDYNKSMKNGLTGELVLSARHFYRNFVGGNIIYNYYIRKSKYNYLNDILYIYPCVYQDYAQYINFWLEYYESFDKPFWQISLIQNVKSTQASLLPFARILLTDIIPARIKVARMNSITSATKILLALHIYKNKHGKFPDKLDALVPGILKKIKVDAVSGKAYNYKKEGKYFKLSGFYLGRK